MRVTDEKVAEIEARAVLPEYGLRQAADVGLLLLDLREARSELASLRQCSTCCGTPHASGLPCICGGTNRAEDEVKNLRLESMILREAVTRMGEELKLAAENYRELYRFRDERDELRVLVAERVENAHGGVLCTYCGADYIIPYGESVRHVDGCWLVRARAVLSRT